MGTELSKNPARSLASLRLQRACPQSWQLGAPAAWAPPQEAAEAGPSWDVLVAHSAQTPSVQVIQAPGPLAEPDASAPSQLVTFFN